MDISTKVTKKIILELWETEAEQLKKIMKLWNDIYNRNYSEVNGVVQKLSGTLREDFNNEAEFERELIERYTDIVGNMLSSDLLRGLEKELG